MSRPPLALTDDEQQDALGLLARLRDCEDDAGEFATLQTDARAFLRGFDTEPRFYRAEY